MTKSMRVLGVLAAVLCLAAASPAFADSFTWSYSGGSDSGSGTMIAAPTGAPGVDLISAMTGTWNGSAITALLATGTCCSSPANDNLLLLPAGPALLDINGLAFGTMGGALDVNIYFCDVMGGCTLGSGYTVLTAPAGGDTVMGFTMTSVDGTFTVVPSAVTSPEPATLLMLGSGLAGLLFSKKRS